MPLGSNSIGNEVHGIGCVVCDISGKPPGRLGGNDSTSAKPSFAQDAKPSPPMAGRCQLETEPRFARGV